MGAIRRRNRQRLMDHLLGNRIGLLAGLDEAWVSKYDWLQRNLHARNVAEDLLYRTRFRDFYFRGVGTGDRFKDVFFGILQREKDNPSVSFEETLAELPDLATGKRPPSFTSKLIATINPDKPVWDNNVWKCLSAYRLGKRVNSSNVENYRRLVETTIALVENPAFATLRDSFDHRFRHFAHFTDMKKLDLYLWECGRQR